VSYRTRVKGLAEVPAPTFTHVVARAGLLVEFLAELAGADLKPDDLRSLGFKSTWNSIGKESVVRARKPEMFA
jgi:hypothetical protein